MPSTPSMPWISASDALTSPSGTSFSILDPARWDYQLMTKEGRRTGQTYEKPLMVAVYLLVTVQPFSSAFLAALYV